MKLSGGQAIVDRLLKAYGFSTKKELGDYFGLGNGTVSTWIKRNHFPGEQVVRCALEKKASLRWLATGEGEMLALDLSECEESSDCIRMEKYEIVSGKLQQEGFWSIDRTVFTVGVIKPIFVHRGHSAWVVDIANRNVTNGLFLLDIDDDFDIYRIGRIPGNRLKVSNDSVTFECGMNDVKIVGAVIVSLNKNI